MTGLEKKLFAFLTKHRFILGLFFITILNAYMRKVLVWWTDDDVVNYYVGHEHMTQGYAWWTVMLMSIKTPILPVHFMKWVATAGDFALAGVGAWIIRREKRSPEAALSFYAVMLINPITLMRSMRWSMTDSLGMVMFMIAHSFELKWYLKAVLYSLGILFCPFLIVPLCIEMWHSKNELVAGCVFVLVFVLASVLGYINGFGFREGVLGQVNFLTFDPLTGLSYETAAEWYAGVLPLFALPVMTLALMRFLTGKSRFVTDGK